MAPTPLEIALAHLEENPTDYLFPLKRMSKHPPLLKDNLGANCSNDPKQIIAWDKEKRMSGCNWGIALRRSRLIVPDIDVSDGKPGLDTYDLLNMLYSWPATSRVKSPTGGYHCYYTGQHIMKISGFGAGLDSSNYVVCPGMPVKGGRYRYVNKLPRVEAPAWFYEVLGRKGERVRAANAAEVVVELDQPHNVADAINYLLHDAPPASEGEGGEYRTMLTAMSLRDLGISEDYALQLMLDHYNEQKCQGPWDYDGLKQKVANGFAYASIRPIGGGTAQHEFAGDPVEPHIRNPDDKYVVIAGTKVEIVRTPRAPRKKKAKKT